MIDCDLEKGMILYVMNPVLEVTMAWHWKRPSNSDERGAPDMSGSRSGCILPSAARMACRHRPMRLLIAACSVGACRCTHRALDV